MKELIKIAEERGYTEVATSKEVIYFAKQENNIVIGLTVFIKDCSFEISYQTTQGCLKLSTNRCSPFNNNEHFERHEKWLLKYAYALKAEEDKNKKVDI